MIKFEQVSFHYEDFENHKNGILNMNLTVEKGECVVLCGVSGCGKTTVTRLINGLIPHFYKGNLSGHVWVDGQEVSSQAIAITSKKVGSVFQNPRTQFFNVDTTSELAFGCENLGLSIAEILKRMEEATGLFNLSPLLNRSIFELSGGEKQRIACGSVFAAHPDIFVMDEPSSSLDGASIEQLREVIVKLKALGKTLVISEHRLHYLKDLADRFIYMEGGEIRQIFSKEAFLNLPSTGLSEKGLRTLSLKNILAHPCTCQKKEDYFSISNMVFKRGKREILNISKLNFFKKEVVALIGENGAGKTTFAKCLCGLLKFKGDVVHLGEKLKPKDLTEQSFMVMQDVNAQLFTESVEDEVTLNLKEVCPVKVDTLLSALNLQATKQRHPMSLSGGQKQRVALASALLANKSFLIYDEPTSGLDYDNMKRMGALIKSTEKATLVITHDPELILSTCDRVIHLENGAIKESYSLDEVGIEKVKDYFIKTEILVTA